MATFNQAYNERYKPTVFLESENKHCGNHGPYIDYLIPNALGEHWQGCPQCMAIALDFWPASLGFAKDHRAVIPRPQNLTIKTMPERYKDKTLSNYTPTCENAHKAVKKAKEYVEGWSAVRAVGQSMIFCGKAGTGKTHIALGIATELSKVGVNVMYVELIELVRMIKETYSRDSHKTEREMIQHFVSPDLLIIDEAGHQLGTPTEKAIMFDIINARYNKTKPNIIITNLTLDEIRNVFDDRVRDRLREGGGKAVLFDWESYRSKAGV